MMRRSGGVAAALLAAALVGGGLTPATDVIAQPNPYGNRIHHAVVTIDDRGGYQIAETFDQVLVRAFDLSLGGSVPDGVRLPDDSADDLPGILRPGSGPVVAVVDGTPTDLEPERNEHALAVANRVEDAPAGDHRAQFTWTRTAATTLDGRTAITYVQPIGPGAVELSRTSGTIDEVRCVTYAPLTEPCGRRTADGWQVSADDRPAALGDGDPLTLQVRWRPGSASARIAPPVIDHR